MYTEHKGGKMYEQPDQALFNMVEQQIRPWEVLDQKVLDTLMAVPRVNFVPDDQQGLAYADTCIKLNHGQCMMAPKMEGRLLQAVNLQAEDTVLEVGTGSGYLTALLAKMCKHVYSVDIYPDFIETADRRIHTAGLTNATLEVGDAATGWSHHAPYDVIAVTASLPCSAQVYLDQLKIGGRCFAVIGEAPVMQATLFQRVDRDQWSQESLFETELPALVNAEQPQKFVF